MTDFTHARHFYIVRFYFVFLAKACRTLVSQPGIEPTPTAVVQNLNYCAAREVPLDSPLAALHRLR